MANKNNPVLRTRNRLLRILTSEYNKKIENKANIETNATKALFSAAELELLANNNRVDRSSATQFSSLQQHLQTTSDNVSKIIADTETFMSMFPEGDKARLVYISSILSPNDMCGNTISVNFENLNLPNDCVQRLESLISDFINHDLQLGTLLDPWIGDALFKKGATPVAVIPRSIIRTTLEKDSTLDIKSVNIKKGKTVDRFDKEIFEGFSTESLSIVPKKMAQEKDDIQISMESVSELTTRFQFENVNKNLTKDDVSSLCSKMANSLQLCSNVDVSVDITKIHTATEAKEDILNKLKENTCGLFSSVGPTNMLAIDSQSVAYEESDEPIFIRLPTSSVIPITIPGSPETRIGFFVVLDADSGTPLDADIPSTDTTLQNRSAFLTDLGDKNLVKNTTVSNRAKIVNDTFDVLINHILTQSLNNLSDVGNFGILNNKNLNIAIFNKLLKKKKITFIFIPTTNMAYFAYDYREDGTGRTVLEKASTVIALRTACLVSKVMTTMDNATTDVRIEYSLPEADPAHIEQMNEILKRSYVDKHLFHPSHNVTTLLNNLTTNSVSTVPKDFAGIKDFSVTKEKNTNSLTGVDEGLEEFLSDMSIGFLPVPSSVLKDTNEKEFSRSVATTNLLFSNSVMHAQQITCREAEVLVKAYILNSYKLLTQMLAILKGAELSKEIADNNTLELARFVVSKLKLNLPAPNVNPDRSLFNDISDKIRILDEVLNGLYPDEVLLDKSEESLNALRMWKQLVKQHCVQDLITRSGDKTLVNIPKMVEVDHLEVARFTQQILNVAAASSRQVNAFKSAALKEQDDEPSENRNSW